MFHEAKRRRLFDDADVAKRSFRRGHAWNWRVPIFNFVDRRRLVNPSRRVGGVKEGFVVVRLNVYVCQICGSVSYDVVLWGFRKKWLGLRYGLMLGENSGLFCKPNVWGLVRGYMLSLSVFLGHLSSGSPLSMLKNSEIKTMKIWVLTFLMMSRKLINIKWNIIIYFVYNK